jgi:hypothetical protein
MINIATIKTNLAVKAMRMGQINPQLTLSVARRTMPAVKAEPGVFGAKFCQKCLFIFIHHLSPLPGGELSLTEHVR